MNKAVAIDWSFTRGHSAAFDLESKPEKIGRSLSEWEKFLGKLDPESTLLFEDGGGETFKLTAYRKGFSIYRINGYLTRLAREAAGYDHETVMRLKRGSDESKEQTDHIDARTILALFQAHPEQFHRYTENDKNLEKLRILGRQFLSLKKKIGRAKNQKIIAEREYQIVDIGESIIKKQIGRQEKQIELMEAEQASIVGLIKKHLDNFPLWSEWLKDVKGVGPGIASVIIGELGNKHFKTQSKLRRYARMIPPPKTGAKAYMGNRKLSVALYYFRECQIKNGSWRPVYDLEKKRYESLHPDWPKWKIHRTAARRMATLFLDEVWDRIYGNGGESLTGGAMLRKGCSPAAPAQ